MTYQLSTEIWFTDINIRDIVQSYLQDKLSLCMEGMNDFVHSEDAIDGTYKVSCTFHFVIEGIRDDVYDFLLGYKDGIDINKRSFVEKHYCGHDEGLPCLDTVQTDWGVGNA